MVLTRIENPNKNLLERLREDKICVRINYFGEKTGPYLGKIQEVGDRDVILLPYTVYESFPIPNGDKFLSRYRIETKYPKVLPLIGILPEPLSEGFLEDFVKLQNYFNSLMISDINLRSKVFNKETYLMPSEEDIKVIESGLLKK